MLLANSACIHIKVVQPLQVFSGFFLLISKMKHALAYVTDGIYRVPNSYKQIGCCFYGLTTCSVY